jgi:hypothetical protein
LSDPTPIPVVSGPDALSLSAASDAVHLSKMAYGKDSLPLGYAIIDMLPVRDVQCLTAPEANVLTFAFRGTDDMRGWMVDAAIKFKDLGNGVKVHTGFWEDVDAIWAKLRPLAEAFAKTGGSIVTTGHSKGAAECRLFTYRLAKELNIKVKQSISFGEPRSLNRGAAKAYNKLNVPTYRIVDANDIVCRLPWRLGLYQHVGRSAFIDKWGNITFDEPWYAHLASDTAEIIKEFFRRENAPFYDHGIDRYIAALENYKCQISQ